MRLNAWGFDVYLGYDDEKSKYRKEIILLIVGAILTLIVALIGSYTQHWFGWNK